jgi:hypothetical protein
MKNTIWIDNPDTIYAEGMTGFLIYRHDESNSVHSRYISAVPARTNRSREAKLHGWCGTTNNIAIYAEGMARIEAINTKTGRAKVTSLSNDETRVALEAAGYPELISEIID